MKNLLKFGLMAFVLGLVFISVDTANAQDRQQVRKAHKEYRKDMKEARKDYRRRVNNGDYRKARKEYREDLRDARKDYRKDTGRRIGRRPNRPVVRYYYRNGRRYVRNN